MTTTSHLLRLAAASAAILYLGAPASAQGTIKIGELNSYKAQPAFLGTLQAGLGAEIQNTVTKGDKVSITGFGVFEKRVRAARTARNPRTGESVKVKKTSVPAFRPGASSRSSWRPASCRRWRRPPRPPPRRPLPRPPPRQGRPGQEGRPGQGS